MQEKLRFVKCLEKCLVCQIYTFIVQTIENGEEFLIRVCVSFFSSFRFLRKISYHK